jgi:tetratricopeptide (TPR) repeat protein
MIRRKGSAILILALLLCGTAPLHCQNTRSEDPTQTFEQLASQAQAALDADEVAEAIRLYNRATALRPNWSEGWWHLGTLLFDSGRFLEARDAFRQFASTEHREPGPGFGMLGLSEFQLKHYTAALAALERSISLGLGSNPEFNHSVLYHDGILNTFLGRPEIAIARLILLANEVAAAHPEAPKDAVLGDLQLLDAFGVAALRRKELPSDIPPAQVALVRKAGRAQAFIALQDLVTARAEFKELVTLYPSAPGVHYAYGVFLLKEAPAEAIDEFHRELRISPSSAVTRIQLALQLERTGDYDQGLKYASEAVALAPKDFVAHVAYSRLWLAKDRNDRALAEARIAVRLSPKSPDAHFALSRALEAAGRNAEAARERTEFQQLKAEADRTAGKQ